MHLEIIVRCTAAPLLLSQLFTFFMIINNKFKESNNQIFK